MSDTLCLCEKCNCMTKRVCGKCAKTDAVEFRNELLMRFNDYEVPLTMTAEQVREMVIQFYEEWSKEWKQRSS